MFISVEDYFTSGDTFTVLHDEIGGALEGEGHAITEVIPFLTTGENEIIGVTYFETEIEVSRLVPNSNERTLASVVVPVVAKSDYEINLSSSELKGVNPENPVMKKGENSVMLFGTTGTMVPDSEMVLYITDQNGVKEIPIEASGPDETSINLVMEPLISMILVGNEFPLVFYMDDSGKGGAEEGETAEAAETSEGGKSDADPRSGVTWFVEDGIITFSANDVLNIDPIQVKKNEDYVLTYHTIEDVGSTTIDGQIDNFEGSAILKTHTSDPTSIHLDVAENILVNGENLATLQLLDSAGNPVYAKKDIMLELVSNDLSVLKIPDQIVIEEGEYFKAFELESLKEGVAEIAILSEDLPLSKYDVSVIDISPELTLNLGGGLSWNERIEAKLTVSIPEIQTSLDGFEVEWVTDGGEVRSIEEVTNNQGIAIMNIMANDKPKVSITAKVSGNGLSSATISQTVDIKDFPIVEVEVVEEETGIISTETLLDTNTLIMIIIPVGIGAGIFMLKRMDKLDMITEKIPIAEKLNMGDKIEEIKEKISDIRNR